MLRKISMGCVAALSALFACLHGSYTLDSSSPAGPAPSLSLLMLELRQIVYQQIPIARDHHMVDHPLEASLPSVDSMS